MSITSKISPSCRTALALISLMVLPWLMGAGCARIPRTTVPEPLPTAPQPWSPESYADFLKKNMADINAVYSTHYAPYHFVVDTESGSQVIQDLIDPTAVADLALSINRYARNDSQRVANIYHHVVQNYRYRLEPDQWEPVSEILRSGQGDCKGLSLLMLSLLLASDIDAYAAISNGHMWVKAYYNKNWHVLEPDVDPARERIYALPDFYAYPLYRIYADQTVKRIPKSRP